MSPLKTNFIHLLQLLASADKQDKYQSEVDVDIAGELVSMWFDDFYRQGERERLAAYLSDRERDRVDEFHRFYDARVDLLPRTYEDLRGSGIWHKVVDKARETSISLGWDSVPTASGFGAV